MARKSIRINDVKSVDGVIRLYIVRGQQLKDYQDDTIHLRIYRKKEDDFLQGVDYQEYFENLNWRDAVLIYDGSVEKQDRFHFVFTDEDVKPLDVFTYWAAYEKDEIPAGPVAVAVRDTSVWWPFSKIQGTMQRIYNQYPYQKDIREYGFSTMNKPLTGLRIGNPDKVIGLVGAIHAGESGAELFLSAIENIIRDYPELPEVVGLAVLPSVNADSREEMALGVPHYLRCNPNQVDLNRNFDASWSTVDYTYGLNTSIFGSATYRGPFPNSENETKAVISFVKGIKPTVIFNGHCLASICSDSFLTAKSAKEDELFNQRGKWLCKAYSNGFRDVEKEGVHYHHGCTAGSLPAFAYEKYKIPAFDMEFRPVKDEQRERLCIVGKTTKDLLDEFIEYHTKGIVNVMKCLADDNI